MSTTLSFKPNNQEEIYIEDNKIEWSKWCHSHLTKDMNNQKYVNLDEYLMPTMMILFGTLILFIGIVGFQNIVLMVMCFLLSMFAISFGIFATIGRYKNAK